jgi:ABC-type branched-subunit amino acid transport system substrate-binding protein
MRQDQGSGCVRRIGIVALFLTAVSAVGTLGCQWERADDSILIGHLAPRTGSSAEEGQALLAVAALTVEAWNQEEPGVFNGRLVSVIHADTASQLDPFVYQATRLIALNQVSALVGGVRGAEASRLHQALMARESAPVAVTPAGLENSSRQGRLWCLGISPSERGKWLATFLTEHAGLNSILVITDTSEPGTLDAHQAFLREFRHPKRQIVAEILTTKHEKLDPISVALRESLAQAVIFVGDRTMLDRVLKIPRRIEMKFVYAGDDEESMWRQPPEAPVLFASALPGERPSPSLDKLATDLRQRCQQELTPASLLTYESLRVLLIAAKRARSFRRDLLVRELEKIDIDLPSGRLWLEPKGNARRPVSIYQIENGRPRWIKTYSPAKDEKS